ncbi:MAG: RagB/SusD family nutrient uptake outer membrane protein [Tannerellaceae bacterium]|nr:RagB/SusD family nutrient uptake outer membrane protein [Tannerellaceae bacterium]
MKKILIIAVSTICMACNSFLEEEPKTFLTPSEYYTSEAQVNAAVNGTYSGLTSLLTTDMEIATVTYFNLEYIVGHCYRSRSATDAENQFLLLSGFDNTNGRFRTFWQMLYIPLENCNSVIENLTDISSDVISTAARDRYLAQVYFMRAYYYFFVVQLYGDSPLKTESTRDLNNIQIPKSPVSAIYDLIVADLEKAASLDLPWTDKSGHVSKGAVKALLTKVYLTMAGYPLQKGTEYYQKAYETARELINSGQFYLFDDYADLRASANENAGEHIFMIQREPVNNSSPFHYGLMPYPDFPISNRPAYGGGLIPRKEFYDAFDDNDKRKADQAFFYMRLPKYNDPETIVEIGYPHIYKFWDDEVERAGGNSGANLPLLRYADVLLMCAEAKANADGGTTSDQVAVDVYFQVRNRAFPSENKPASITADQVYKERFFELCFELQNWFDMLRTRKAFDPVSNKIVPLIGYKAPNHEYAFKETDLLFPIHYREIEMNPLLGE